MKKHIATAGIIVLGAVAGLISSVEPAPAESPETLTIAAAHSLKGVLRSILPEFEAQHPNTTVRVVYGPSKTIRRYIEEGAPVDLFLPSSVEEIELLERKGLVLAGKTKVYAQTPIVLITGSAVSAPIGAIQDVGKPEVRRIAVGNPETSSVGKLAIQLFKHARLDPEIRPRYVYGEHSAAVLSLVESGEADVGAVYRADTIHNSRVRIIAEAPAGSHSPARYGLATVWTAANVSSARAFERFMFTSPVQNALHAHGFTAVEDGVVVAHQ